MKSEYDTISSMSIEERTERYTIRRSAELRGQRDPYWMDEDTEKYIARRIAELRGYTLMPEPIEDDPYISRRIAYLRATGQ